MSAWRRDVVGQWEGSRARRERKQRRQGSPVERSTAARALRETGKGDVGVVDEGRDGGGQEEASVDCCHMMAGSYDNLGLVEE